MASIHTTIGTHFVQIRHSRSGPRIARELRPGFNSGVDDAWTTGNIQGLVHDKCLASGGFGGVHKKIAAWL